MPDDPRTDDALVKDAYDAVDRLVLAEAWQSGPKDARAEGVRDTVAALCFRIYQLREQCQESEDKLAHVQQLLRPVRRAMSELDSFFRSRGKP